MYKITYSDHTGLENLLQTDQDVEDYVDLNPIYCNGALETPISIYFIKNQDYKRSGIYSLLFGDKTAENNKDQYMSFPIIEHQLKSIIDIYGKSTNNNDWIIDPKYFQVGKNTKNWSNKFAAIISRTKREFGIYNDVAIKPEIESMIISSKDSTYEPQLSPSDATNLVGILYLILPSHYSGGGLVVESIKEQTKESKSSIQLENHNPTDLCYITVSKDSLYQFEPITEGYRVMLKINLLKTNKRLLDGGEADQESSNGNSADVPTINKKSNSNIKNSKVGKVGKRNSIGNGKGTDNSNGFDTDDRSPKDSTDSTDSNVIVLDDNVDKDDSNKAKVNSIIKHIHSILDQIESSLDSVKSNYLIYGLPESSGEDSVKSEETIVLNNLLAARHAEQKLNKFGIYMGVLLIKVEHIGSFRNNRGTSKTFISSSIEKIQNVITEIKDLSGNPFNRECLATEELSELLPKNCLVGLKPFKKIDDLEAKRQTVIFKKRVILINQPKKKIYN